MTDLSSLKCVACNLEAHPAATARENVAAGSSCSLDLLLRPEEEEKMMTWLVSFSGTAQTVFLMKKPQT